LRYQPDCFREGDVFYFLNELENVALLVTTKAVVELLRGMHRERRRLLPVKRTKPGIVLRPGPFQLDVVTDDADDIRLLLHRLFEVFRGWHGWIGEENRDFSLWIVSQTAADGNIPE
jgi:hypothetical protein